MTDWLDKLSPDERRQWDEWVTHIRRDAAQKIAGSAAFVSIVPKGEPDIKFAVELGLAIMLDKPLLVVASGPIPKKLRYVSDAIVFADLDTEEGRAKVSDAVDFFLRSLA